MADFKTVDVPGLGTVQFPAEMSNDEIVSAINSYKTTGDFAAEPETTLGGIASSVTRSAGPYGAAAAAGGLAGGPGGATAGVAAMGLSKFLGDPLVMGVNKVFDTNFSTPTEALNKVFDSMGLENPDTATEQFISILGEGVASGPVQAGRSTAKQMIQGAMQATAGETARITAETAGAGQGAQLASSLVAGIGAGYISAPRGAVRPRPSEPLPVGDMAVLAKHAAKGNDAAKHTLASQAANGVDASTMSAAKELGVDGMMTPGMITTNKHFRELENALAEFPESAIRDRRDRIAWETTQKADELLREISRRTDSGDMSQLDFDLKQRRLLDIDELDIQAKGLYDDLKATVDASAPAPAPSILAHIEQRIAELGGGDRKKGISALSTLERSVYKRLYAPKRMKDGVVYEQHPTYAMLDDVRKDIGDAAREKGAFKDAPSGQASKLYGLITEDQGAAIRDLGGDPKKWELAKSKVKQSKAIQDTMTAIYGKELDKGLAPFLEGATRGLAQGDVAKWSKIMDLVPDDMRPRVAAGALSRVLYKKSATGEMQLDDFVKWYEAVKRNKRANRALLEPIKGDARLGLENIYRVSKAIETTGQGKNSAYVAGAIGGAQSLMHHLYATAFKVSGIQLFSDLMERANLSRAGAYRLGMEVPNALMVSSKAKNIGQVNRLIGSPEFMDLVRAMADGRPLEKYVNGLTRSQMFITFARQSGLSTRQEDMQAYVRQGLIGLPPKSEQ